MHRLSYALPFTILLLLLTLGTTPPQATAQQGTRQLRAKADPWVISATAEGEEAEFLIFMAEQADLSAAHNLESRFEKGRFVYQQLTATANRTQPDLIQSLQSLNVDYQPFWIANMIWVRGDREVAETVASRPDVGRLVANPSVQIAPIPAQPEGRPESASDVEWNIDLINAPDVWAEGFRGEGVVIGGQDTGYDWQHPALRDQYRGWDGTAADHNYNWHDAIHSGDGVCRADSDEPCDDLQHGTHTMGIMVGDDGAENQIGVAPGAQWVGCRNMDNGVGTPATYSECFQWFVAPTDLNNQNPDPAKAPHIVNNSWACPPSEGCDDRTLLQTVVENTRAAGIVVVTSAGNNGPFCSTVQYAPGIYDAAFSIGATNSSDTIATFSSRGPVTIDGSNRMKPDVVAPGVNIRSSVPGGGYGNMSGTSMAAPHAAGLAALLISARPSLAGDVEQLEMLIKHSTLPLTTDETCGSVPGNTIPNHTYGHGRIDALEAYNRLQTPLSYYLYLPLWIEEQSVNDS
jgi:subtilisin family serine protease